jgi:hypothetical protein
MSLSGRPPIIGSTAKHPEGRRRRRQAHPARHLVAKGPTSGEDPGVASFEACLDEPVTAAEERFLATRERIMIRRNPVQLAREEIEGERVRRVIEATAGG